MSSSFGKIFRVSTFGESHGGAVGVILDGCPPKLKIDINLIPVSYTHLTLPTIYSV